MKTSGSDLNELRTNIYILYYIDMTIHCSGGKSHKGHKSFMLSVNKIIVQSYYFSFITLNSLKNSSTGNKLQSQIVSIYSLL